MSGGLFERIMAPPARHAWAAMGWGWVALVVYLSLTPTPPRVDLGVDFADKLQHLFAYAWLMGWLTPLFSDRRPRLRLAAALVVLGVTLEFLQYLGGVRYLEVGDMLANTTGVLLALGAWEWIGKRESPTAM